MSVASRTLSNSATAVIVRLIIAAGVVVAAALDAVVVFVVEYAVSQHPPGGVGGGHRAPSTTEPQTKQKGGRFLVNVCFVTFSRILEIFRVLPWYFNSVEFLRISKNLKTK